jgi:hypothetical protein
VYRPTSFTNGSGEHLFVFFLIQPRADKPNLAVQLSNFDKDRASQAKQLYGVPPFDSANVLWPDYNPVRLLNYENRFYFMAFWPGETSVVKLLLLRGDGSAVPTCTIQIIPEAQFPGVASGNEPGWPRNWQGQNRERVDSITLPPELSRFLGEIRRMQGEEGRSSGTLHSLSRHLGISSYYIEKSVVQPWDILAHGDALPRPEVVQDTESHLQSWAMESVSNYHLFENYRRGKDAAFAALRDLYRDRFGLNDELAKRYSTSSLNAVIAVSFYFYGDSPAPEADDNLRSKLLAGAPREEISALLTDDLVNKRSPSGEPSFFFALEHPEMLEMLIGRGADLAATNAFGRTALMYAAQFNLEKSVRLLVQRSASVAAATASPDISSDLPPIEIAIRCDHRTALMYAAENASAAVISLLLDVGADPQAKDTCGRSVADYLAKNTAMTAADKEAIGRRLSAP